MIALSAILPPYRINAWRRVNQKHRHLRTLNTEILLVKASEMIIKDEIHTHLLPLQSILDPRGSNNLLLWLLYPKGLSRILLGQQYHDRLHPWKTRRRREQCDCCHLCVGPPPPSVPVPAPNGPNNYPLQLLYLKGQGRILLGRRHEEEVQD